MKNILFTMCLATASLPTIAQTKRDTLLQGSPAPSLQGANWIKGEKIDAFKKGNVYVIEFWATWCGPCRMAMPHLSELANEYKGKAVFLSINSKETASYKDKNEDPTPRIKEFVKKLGDGMDYNVAMDGPGDPLWKNWMTAGGFSSIPKSFLVGRDGKIAWIGHPEEIDEVLAAVVKGNYTEAEKERIKEQNKLYGPWHVAMFKQLRAAQEKKDYATIVAITDTAIARVKPSSVSYIKTIRLHALCHTDKAAGHTYGQALIKDLHRDPISLYSIGREIVFQDPTPEYTPDYELGLEFLQAAAAHSDAFDQPVLSGLAKAYSRTGKLEEAVKLQKQALQVIQESKFMKYGEASLEKANKALAEYEAALKNG